jgi:hypothetical protein
VPILFLALLVVVVVLVGLVGLVLVLVGLVLVLVLVGLVLVLVCKSPVEQVAFLAVGAEAAAAQAAVLNTTVFRSKTDKMFSYCIYEFF